MKKFRVVIVWSVFCIFIECLVLLYIDRVMFKHSSDFTVNEISSTQEKDNENDISVHDDAELISSSYNGKYSSYYLDDRFYVVNSKDSSKKEVITDREDKSVLFAKWLPDRNIIVIAEKSKNIEGRNVITLKNYDAKEDNVKTIKEICAYENGMKIDDIATTTLSGVSYVAIGRKNSTSVIYRIDINEKIKKVSTVARKVGSMDIFPHEDTLVYEDKATNRYYRYTNGNTKRIDLSKYGNVELLSLDSSGTVYMGQIKNKKINNIVYGNYKDITSKWKNRSLGSEKDENDIFINSSKQLLLKEGDEVKNIDTGESIEYIGDLIEIKDNVICSRQGNTVYVKRI